MILWLALLVATPGATPTDPRIEWTELERAGRLQEAAAAVRRQIDSDSEPTGSRYLLGRLLAGQERLDEAAEAFAAGLGAEAPLAPWSRFRLAELEVDRGHPEVAAGLLATLLGNRPPERLAKAAGRLLAVAVDRGGDCRVLAARDRWRLPDTEARDLALTSARCDLRAGRRAEGVAALQELLGADTGDGVAYEAATELAALGTAPDAATALEMARAFFAQRSFDLALEQFTAALDPATSDPEVRRDYDVHYSIARAYFWLGDYLEAASRFDGVAGLAENRRDRARAFYQQARCLELAGRPAQAEAALARVRSGDPFGDWSAAALVSSLRLAWLGGRQPEALGHFATLGSRRNWRGSRGRAALFLSASDLSLGRTDRAGAWLSIAAATSGTHPPELHYWQGRHAELELRNAEAVRHYVTALVADPYDPWSLGARRRLANAELRPEAEAMAEAAAGNTRVRDHLRRWLLSGHGEAGAQALAALRQRLTELPPAREFMALTPVAVAGWPLWLEPQPDDEATLLTAGDWRFGLGAGPEHFPATDDRLSLTRAELLAEAGLPRSAILVGELLARRSAGAVPPPLWPVALRKALHPLAYGDLIVGETIDRGIDPRLLAGLIREESRFDADALSAAAARGLTQFVLPTARRLGGELGLPPIAARDLFEPALAIRLGAAYLDELGRRFGPRPHQILAAYNAGESQSELWRSYCVSDDPEEFLTKIGFRETRGYVRKVLRSYAAYRELYPVLPTTVSGMSPSTSSK